MLLRLLALPVSAPVKGSLWIIDQIVKAADAQLGEGATQQEIAGVRAAYERGEIDEDELSAMIDPLLDELLAARTPDLGEGLA